MSLLGTIVAMLLLLCTTDPTTFCCFSENAIANGYACTKNKTVDFSAAYCHFETRRTNFSIKQVKHK